MTTIWFYGPLGSPMYLWNEQILTGSVHHLERSKEHNIPQNRYVRYIILLLHLSLCSYDSTPSGSPCSFNAFLAINIQNSIISKYMQ